MSTSKKTTETETPSVSNELELRKVKALEKIANSMDALVIWFEEIDKEEWSDRIQYYLTEFHKLVPKEDSTLNG